MADPGAVMQMPFVTMIDQREDGDCGIVALAMLLSKSYGDVLEAAAGITKKPHRSGMYVSQIVEAANRLGCVLRRKKVVDLENDTGILLVTCKAKRKREAHVNLLRWGLIIDSGEVWEPDAWLAKYKATVDGILIKED